jgi:tetracycline 7-halogenase / FADH2 O2-dependent halogenase
METVFDVAIIGSGIAGSALAAILARQGQRVILFEAKNHPRFAIGESLILETSEMMRALATYYDVPELAYFSTENYAAFQGTSHGVKRHFGFLHHTPGQPHLLERTLQAVIPHEPYGHELHLYRQDTDYFLAATAVAYGATLLQNSPVTAVDFGAELVTLTTAQGDAYRARYLVDAGGFRSLVAQQFGLRDFGLQTHARGLFTHMVNVPCYHQTNRSQAAYGLPYRMSEGTLHHVFHGGWLWVIPFDNHPGSTNPLCSVGLMLDPRLHPERPDLTPEAEFRQFIDQFPSIAAQFDGAQAVRPWTRAGRIQYGSRQVVGERWALLGHAAGFIDPLYSKGLYLSTTAVFTLAHLLLKAGQTGDYSAAAFADLERVTHNMVCSADRLVANSYKAFSDYRLWQNYAVVWLLGAYLEYVRLNTIRLQAGSDRDAYYRQLVQLKLVGGGFTEFETAAAEIDGLMEQVDVADEAVDETAVTRTAARIDQILRQLDWAPPPFIDLLDGKNHLPKNKLRLGLLDIRHGFLGSGDYRRHFFGHLNLLDLLRFGLREKAHYSRAYLNWQHRQLFRQKVG